MKKLSLFVGLVALIAALGCSGQKACDTKCCPGCEAVVSPEVSGKGCSKCHDSTSARPTKRFSPYGCGCGETCTCCPKGGETCRPCPSKCSKECPGCRPKK